MHSGFIQLMMTSLWGIWVGIPVISIKFLKIENDLLLQPSDIIPEVAFSRVGNWKHHKYFAFGNVHWSKLIHTHNISYNCQNIILSSSALGLWVVFKILFYLRFFLRTKFSWKFTTSWTAFTKSVHLSSAISTKNIWTLEKSWIMNIGEQKGDITRK